MFTPLLQSADRAQDGVRGLSAGGAGGWPGHPVSVESVCTSLGQEPVGAMGWGCLERLQEQNRTVCKMSQSIDAPPIFYFKTEALLRFLHVQVACLGSANGNIPVGIKHQRCSDISCDVTVCMSHGCQACARRAGCWWAACVQSAGRRPAGCTRGGGGAGALMSGLRTEHSHSLPSSADRKMLFESFFLNQVTFKSSHT